jgi:hypothetical protein
VVSTDFDIGTPLRRALIILRPVRSVETRCFRRATDDSIVLSTVRMASSRSSTVVSLIRICPHVSHFRRQGRWILAGQSAVVLSFVVRPSVESCRCVNVRLASASGRSTAGSGLTDTMLHWVGPEELSSRQRVALWSVVVGSCRDVLGGVDRDKVLLKVGKPGWRNGRRGGLKIHCPKGRAGSNPAPGTVVPDRLGRSERLRTSPEGPWKPLRSHALATSA